MKIVKQYIIGTAALLMSVVTVATGSRIRGLHNNDKKNNVVRRQLGMMMMMDKVLKLNQLGKCIDFIPTSKTSYGAVYGNCKYAPKFSYDSSTKQLVVAGENGPYSGMCLDIRSNSNGDVIPKKCDEHSNSQQWVGDRPSCDVASDNFCNKDGKPKYWMIQNVNDGDYLDDLSDYDAYLEPYNPTCDCQWFEGLGNDFFD